MRDYVLRMKLSELNIGSSAKVTAVNGNDNLRFRLLDMGITPGVSIKLLSRAPLGDPIEILVRGYCLTLGLSEAERIDLVAESPKPQLKNEACAQCSLFQAGKCSKPSDSSGKDCDFGYLLSVPSQNPHPGYGEEGRYHRHEGKDNKLPKDTVLKFALVGQSNCGKTALFNAMTGSQERVGNFPGVTVKTKDAPLLKHPNTMLTDMPGVISLDVYPSEENVVRDFIAKERPHCIINVVDASNIERNLYLTVQLLGLGIPVVLALNMMDEVRKNGGSIRVNELESELGIPVVPVSAAKSEGIKELIDHAMHIARYCETPAHPPQFVLPSDSKDPEAELSDLRYNFIERLCANTVIKPLESKEYKRSRRIDKILTGKYTAIPIFMLMMVTIIYLSIDVLGAPLQDLLDRGISLLAEMTDALLINVGAGEMLRSLISDGVFSGVGSVLSFLPIIIILFFFLSFLEDSGYMSRVAFVTDRLLRSVGLSGRSIVPLLIGFGCSVPAIMSSRTIPSSSDRKKTILLIPFMSCSAKIPVYAFFCDAFFPGRGGLVLSCMYLGGVLMAVLVALGNKLLGTKTAAAPFVMEMPNYRLPQMKNVAKLLWEKAKDFLTNAFTVIFMASIVIWFLQHFSFSLTPVTDGEGSILYWLAGFLAIIFQPLGIGHWKIVTALISGFIAKESIVSSLEVLGATSLLTPASSISMLVFCLLYTPCVAATATVKRELGGKYAIIMVAFQCALAWLAAFIAYQIALMLM